jgi:hypothetical protein
LYRGTAYPEAVADSSYDNGGGLCANLEMAFCYPATQIGRFPYWINPTSPEIKENAAAAVWSIEPSINVPFPWNDQRESLSIEYYARQSDSEYLVFEDSGCVYIAFENGQIHHELQSG